MRLRIKRGRSVWLCEALLKYTVHFADLLCNYRLISWRLDKKKIGKKMFNVGFFRKINWFGFQDEEKLY